MSPESGSDYTVAVVFFGYGAVSGLFGLTLILFRIRVLTFVRRRYKEISDQYRDEGRAGISPGIIPNMTVLVLVALGSFALASCAMAVGLTLLP